MTFEECCLECLRNNEFVKQFNRLNRLHLGERITGINAMIDKACNYDPDAKAIPEFVKFVFDYIWTPM